MTRSRFGLLALCAAVFGVMALGAVAAHGEAGANWLILMKNGEVLTGAQLNALIGGEVDQTIILLTTILKDKTEITCPKVALSGAKLIKEGTISEGTVTFKECKTKINGTLNANCTPHSGGEAVGTVRTEPVTGLIKLHELTGGVKDDTVLLLPVNAAMRFATLVMSESCPIGETVPLFGELSFKDCEGNFLKHLVKHLFEEFAPLTKMWMISETEEHRTTIDGSVWAFLLGEHEGLAWAGDPA